MIHELRSMIKTPKTVVVNNDEIENPFSVVGTELN